MNFNVNDSKLNTFLSKYKKIVQCVVLKRIRITSFLFNRDRFYVSSLLPVLIGFIFRTFLFDASKTMRIVIKLKENLNPVCVNVYFLNCTNLKNVLHL